MDDGVHPKAIMDARARERHIRHAERIEAVGRLVGGIAHDFNNLLTAISGQTDLLLDRVEAPEDRAALQEIRHAVDQATALTDHILAVSRDRTLDVRPLDLNRVVEEAHGLIDRLIGDDVEVVRELDASLGPVEADAVQLERAIVNLAVNARDAMPGGGTLTLSTERTTVADELRPVLAPGTYALLRVADTGCGMDQETLDRIFDPFFSTKTDGAGTGLGLGVVYRVVRECGGAVLVESEPGEGAAFELYLPVAAAGAVPVHPAETADDEAEAADDEAELHGDATVLVVEDDPAVRSVMTKVLASYGYTVLEAPDGAGALQVIESGDPVDLVITDLSMPGMGGGKLIRRLERTRPTVPVIATSGYSPGEDIEPVRSSLPFLQKPFRPIELARLVRRTLDA